MKLLCIIKSLWHRTQTSAKMLEIDARISSISAEARRDYADVVDWQQEVDEAFNALEVKLNKAKEVIQQLEQTNRKLEEALHSSRESLRTANDIVIPGLVSACKVFQDRWDAQSAHFIMQQTAAGRSPDEG